MSTRLRVIVKGPNGGVTKDKVAVLQLCMLAGPSNYSKALKGLPGSKKERLQQLATQLPKGYTLILVQEPKHTRKSRSYCWGKMPSKKPVPAPVAQAQQVVLQAQQHVAQQVQWFQVNALPDMAAPQPLVRRRAQR